MLKNSSSFLSNSFLFFLRILCLVIFIDYWDQTEFKTSLHVWIISWNFLGLAFLLDLN